MHSVLQHSTAAILGQWCTRRAAHGNLSRSFFASRAPSVVRLLARSVSSRRGANRIERTHERRSHEACVRACVRAWACSRVPLVGGRRGIILMLAAHFSLKGRGKRRAKNRASRFAGSLRRGDFNLRDLVVKKSFFRHHRSFNSRWKIQICREFCREKSFQRPQKQSYIIL